MRVFLLLLLMSVCFFVQAQDVEKTIRKGDKFIEKVKFRKALTHYLKAQGSTSANYTLSKKIAQAYFRSKDFKKAQKWYFELLHFNEQTPEDYQYLIKSFLQTKNYDQALEFLNLLNWFYSEELTPEIQVFSEWVQFYIYNNGPCQGDLVKDYNIKFCMDLDASPSADPMNPNIKFIWDDLTGNVYYGKMVRLCFDEPGNKQIKLTAIDSSINYNYVRTVDTLLTLPFLPEANFSIKGERRIGKPVNFIAYNLTRHEDYWGMIWDFDNGESLIGDGVSCTFNQIDSYTINLHVLAKNQNGDIYTLGCLSKIWNVTKK